MIKFEKPDYKITEYQESNHFAKFEIEPLERGFGTTIGNAMRRVLYLVVLLHQLRLMEYFMNFKKLKVL